MILARRVVAMLLMLVVCSACDRAEPDAAFRELTEPFTEVTAECWPFAGEPPFTTPWFSDGFTVNPPEATLSAEVFQATAERVTTELAAFPDAVVSPAEGGGPVRVEITGTIDVTAASGCSS